MTDKITFSIICDKAGFRRSVEVPITEPGFIRQLSEDFDVILASYELRIKLHALRVEVRDLTHAHQERADE